MKKIILLLVLLFMSQPLQAMDRATIRRQVRLLINDAGVDTLRRRFLDGDINNRINQGQLDIVDKTLCLSSQTISQVSINVSSYTLPTSCLFIERVAYSVSGSSSVFKKLEYATLRGMDENTSLWESSGAGLPTKYFAEGNLITFYLKPSATYYYKINFVPQPDTMDEDTDVPFTVASNTNDWLRTYDKLIVWYVVFLCYADMGSPNAAYWEAKYLYGVAQMIEELNAQPDRSGQIQYRPK